MTNIPDAYIGREQAFVKHTVLKSYLVRLFMIVGRNKELVINYVDCFAGPWQDNDEKLSDTSIGISLAQIEMCRDSLVKSFNRDVKFRALYIEKDATAFLKLQKFLSVSPYQNIEAHCIRGDYADLLKEIVEWCGPHFTFFFVDPKGWLNIGANLMRPLLQLPRAEFLINLMYDFVNRAATIPKHEKDMEALFGKVPLLNGSSPEDRRTTQLQLYRQALTAEYRGRSTYVPIEKPGRERVHYFLIYLTRNAIGLNTFKEIAEEMGILQRNVRAGVKIRTKEQESGITDMFASQLPEVGKGPVCPQDAKSYLLSKLGTQATRIDHELWADFLEESEFFPSELQAAMKALVQAGFVENMDASVQRRTKNVVKLAYFTKSERWRVRQSPLPTIVTN